MEEAILAPAVEEVGPEMLPIARAGVARGPHQPVGDVPRFLLVAVPAHGPVRRAAHGEAALRQGPLLRTAHAEGELYWAAAGAPEHGGAGGPGAADLATAAAFMTSHARVEADKLLISYFS